MPTTSTNANEKGEQWAFRSTWLDDAEQAHVEYNEDQSHGF